MSEPQGYRVLARRLARDHCVAIEDLFTRPVKVTCIVRVVGNNEADVLVTSDTLDDVVALIERSRAREPIDG